MLLTTSYYEQYNEKCMLYTANLSVVIWVYIRVLVPALLQLYLMPFPVVPNIYLQCLQLRQRQQLLLKRCNISKGLVVDFTTIRSIFFQKFKIIFFNKIFIHISPHSSYPFNISLPSQIHCIMCVRPMPRTCDPLGCPSSTPPLYYSCLLAKLLNFFHFIFFS